MPAPEAMCSDEAFAALDRLTDDIDGALGLAISGGSDSSALAVIASEWARSRGRQIFAATVDHHLRPESGKEAKIARGLADRLGIAHQILDWQADDASESHLANLSAKARNARQRLLSGWARDLDLGAVMLGHTQDDQAETVLMRLLRGSGADGLSGMAESVILKDTLWLRPLLSLRRRDLRAFLRSREIGWVDDPTNQNNNYERVRLRQAMAELELSTEGLAQTAKTLARQRRVLERDRDRLAQEAVSIGICGELYLEEGAFAAAEEDTSLAVLADAICWIGNLSYRPRFQSLMHLWQNCGQHTLGGVVSQRSDGRWTLFRELAATEITRNPIRNRWDGRWEISLPDVPELTVKALGEEGHLELKKREHVSSAAWQACARHVRLTAPSVWQGKTLLAVPAAGFHDEEWVANPAFRSDLGPLPARFGRSERL